MTLRTLLAWLCGLCLCAGLALRDTAAYTQAPHVPPPSLWGQRPDANNPLASLQFDTQIGLRIEPPEQSPRS